VGGRDRRIAVQGLPKAKKARPYLKNKLKQQGWGYGSSKVA
jgi:hypothetical protein